MRKHQKRGQEIDRKAANRGLTRRTLGGLFWTSSGTAVESVVQIIVTVVLARLLAPADFGLVATAGIFVGFCQIFSNLGVGPAIIQRAHLGDRHLRTGFTVSISVGLFFTAITILLTPQIAQFFRMPALIPVLWAISPAFLIKSTSVVAESLLRRELRFRALAKVQVISFLVGSAVVTVSLAWLGFGAWALVAGQLVETTLATGILLFLRPHPKRPRVNRRAFKDLIYFGGWITVSRVGNFLALRGDYMVTGRWLGASALGFYTRAYSLIAVPAHLFSTMADKVLFPTMAKIQNEPQRLATVFRRGIVLTSLIALPVSAVLLVLAPEFVLVLFGPKWTPVIAPLQILAIGIFFRIGYKVSGILARAQGTVSYLALIQALYAFFVIAGAFIGQFYGISGIAVGVLLALLLHYFLMSWLSLKYLPIRTMEFLKAHVPALMLAMITLGVSVGVADFLRSLTANSFVVLFVGLSVVGVTWVALIHFVPRIFLGSDGIWWVQTLSQNLKQGIRQLGLKGTPPAVNENENRTTAPVSLSPSTVHEGRSTIAAKDPFQES